MRKAKPRGCGQLCRQKTKSKELNEDLDKRESLSKGEVTLERSD